jgi:hypothetical protein
MKHARWLLDTLSFSCGQEALLTSEHQWAVHTSQSKSLFWDKWKKTAGMGTADSIRHTHAKRIDLTKHHGLHNHVYTDLLLCVLQSVGHFNLRDRRWCLYETSVVFVYQVSAKHESLPFGNIFVCLCLSQLWHAIPGYFAVGIITNSLWNCWVALRSRDRMRHRGTPFKFLKSITNIFITQS